MATLLGTTATGRYAFALDPDERAIGAGRVVFMGRLQGRIALGPSPFPVGRSDRRGAWVRDR